METVTLDMTVEEPPIADLPPSPVPMEIETDTTPTQNLVDAQIPDECKENNESNLELENSNNVESPEDEADNTETKDDVLKGILKHKHIYGLDKKSVDFDMDIELIPYNNMDYTADIQFVKELTKKVVSYRELFKKIAAEEKAAKDIPPPTDDEEDEPEDTKSFSHLILKEPPIHHSSNDIDVNKMKALKATTGQNEKKEDSANICQQDVYQNENEIISSAAADSNRVLEMGKFSVTPVDECLECRLNINTDMQITQNGIALDNEPINNEVENRELCSTYPDTNSIMVNDNSEGELSYNMIEKANEHFVIGSGNDGDHERKERTEDTETQSDYQGLAIDKDIVVQLDQNNDFKCRSGDPNINSVDDSFFNFNHEYLYSDDNDEGYSEQINVNEIQVTNESDEKELISEGIPEQSNIDSTDRHANETATTNSRLPEIPLVVTESVDSNVSFIDNLVISNMEISNNSVNSCDTSEREKINGRENEPPKKCMKEESNLLIDNTHSELGISEIEEKVENKLSNYEIIKHFNSTAASGQEAGDDNKQKPPNIDITYAHNGSIQDKHYKAMLESIKEERSFNISKEITDEPIVENTVSGKLNSPSSPVAIEVDCSSESISTNEKSNVSNVKSISDQTNISKNNPETSLKKDIDKAFISSSDDKSDIDENKNEIIESKPSVNGYIKGNMSTKEIGIQTDLDLPYSPHCLKCICFSHAKANVRDQNVNTSGLAMSSVNSSENIEMLARDTEHECQEDKSMTDTSEGNFKDFSQSTNFDCSLSMSMESFEMDDNSLRIDSVNGCPSID